MVVRFLEPLRQLALGEAALGNLERAAQILDTAIARHQGRDNHLLIGLLHKARAEVSFKQSDVARTEQELLRAETELRATRNPAAIAQWERLSERLLRGERALARTADAQSVDDPLTIMTQKVHSELFAADDPFSCALSLALARSKAKSAFLYVLRGDGLSLAAGSSPVEPATRARALAAQ